MSTEWLEPYATAELDRRFRERIGFERGRALDREGVDALLVAAGRSIPFENLALTDPAYPRVDPESVAAKILERNEGGLCYEINPLVALALRANGVDARVIRATIADPATGGWFPLARTHVTTVATIDGVRYLADAGFGVKQPLGLVPFGGEAVTAHGRYRVARGVLGAEWGLEYVPAGEPADADWVPAYGFAEGDEVAAAEELDEVRGMIANRPESVFNRGTLVALPTERGRVVLSDRGLTEWRDGRRSVLELDAAGVGVMARVLLRRFE